MKIKRLVLHNFGIYANTNIFDFNGDKPVVLIGGLNGRGKTTFLEAVLIALYGSNSFAYLESTYKSYNKYLRSYVNTSDSTLETYVELEFTMDDTNDENYIVKRDWNAKGARTSEQIHVWKNGVVNSFLADNWAMFVENILPSGLSNFFFFDGEKIAELAVESNNQQMTDSIKALLGITVIDSLQSDIRKVNRKHDREKVKNTDILQIDALRERKEELEGLKDTLDIDIEEQQIKIDELNKQLEKKNQEYTAKGGDVVAKQQDLFEERVKCAYSLEQLQEDLLADASSELPLTMVKELLFDVREEAELEHEQKMLHTALKKMQGAYKKFAAQNDELAGGAGAFIEYFQGLTSKHEYTDAYNLSDLSLVKLETMLDESLTNLKLDVRDRQWKYIQILNRIKELDNYLSVEIDEKSISKIFKQIKKLELDIKEQEVVLNEMQNKRKSTNGELMSVSSQFNKLVEGYLKKVEANDDNVRSRKYAEIALSVLDEYKIRLQKEKAAKVAETMTKCYRKLADKKNLIDRIEMDEVTLNLLYYNSENEEIPKTSLSAGEKQLMVISLLWALAICSKKKLPVIIDTPLSRLDSNHRTALIESYFPNASDQTIILSTDSEIDQKYYELMKPTIGDEFTLCYDDTTKSTTIRKGYLLEAGK